MRLFQTFHWLTTCKQSLKIIRNMHYEYPKAAAATNFKARATSAD